MKNGRSVDTTAGFSAFDGLPMATSCGSIDPGVVLGLLDHMSREQLENLLYRRSGLLGMSETSGDMRTLLQSHDPRAAAAVEFFVYRVIRGIGSLAAAAGGLDALVFTAGIGTHSPAIRARICRGLAWLGIALDPAANEQQESCISPPGRCPSVWVIPADEQNTIARHTWRIVSRLPQHFGAWQGGKHERAFKTGHG
jgi:acetate kinase